MDNVQNCVSYINIPSSKTYRSYLYVGMFGDSLCGLAVRVPDYRSRGPGSIPGATKFSEK
jgi:hypothetical protein